MVISHSWGVRIQVMCAWHLEQSVRIKRLKCLLPFLLHPYSCAECVRGCTCHWGLSWPQGGLCSAWFGAHIYIIIGGIRALETWQRLDTPLPGQALRSPALPGSPGSTRDCRLSHPPIRHRALPESCSGLAVGRISAVVPQDFHICLSWPKAG